MEPVQQFIQTNDVKLSYYEWGNKNDPTILMVHATGMNSRVWDATIAALPSGYHIIAVDLRGHGDSPWSGHLLDWGLVGQDVKNIIQSLDLKSVIGVGHSMGGHAVLQAALSMPDRFDRLVLVDPVVFPPARYNVVSDFEKGDPKNNPIARRRAHFDNWQAMFEIFSTRPPYSGWKPEILEKYCRYGAVADGNGVTLACTPETEASVYMGHCSVNLTEDLSQLAMPVKVLRARPSEQTRDGKIDFSASPTWAGMAAALPFGEDVFLPQLSHFIPMEDPVLTARYIAS
jgi:pimeloyl-ACP methyl ester carboxylesterase